MTVKMHPFAAHIGAGATPVLERDVIAEDNAHLFQNIKRCRVDLLDLLGIHRFCQRQPYIQRWQHCMIGAGADVPPFAPSATSTCILGDLFVHEFASLFDTCH